MYLQIKLHDIGPVWMEEKWRRV